MHVKHVLIAAALAAVLAPGGAFAAEAAPPAADAPAAGGVLPAGGSAPGEDEWVTDAKAAVSAEDLRASNQNLERGADGSRDLGAGCSKPEPLPEVTVDEPVVKRVDLTATQGSREIVKGDTIGKIAAEVRGTSGLSTQKIVTAIARANPKTFPNGVLIAGKTLVIPSAERIALESEEGSKEVYKWIVAGALGKHQLPPLVLPWAAEEAKIAGQKEAKARREREIAQRQADYEACLAALRAKKLQDEERRKREAEEARLAEERRAREAWEMEHAEADLGSDDFMIAEPEETPPPEEEHYTLNEQGKRVIVLKPDGEKDGEKKDGAAGPGEAEEPAPELSGANIVFSGSEVYALDSKGHRTGSLGEAAAGKELKRVKQELEAARGANQELIDERDRQSEKITLLEKQLDGLSSKIDGIADFQSRQARRAAAEAAAAARAAAARERAREEEGGYGALWWILGIAAALFAYAGWLVPYLKKSARVRSGLREGAAGSVLIDNRFVTWTARVKAKLRAKLRAALDASEKSERDLDDLIEEERREAEEERRKTGVFFRTPPAEPAAPGQASGDAAASGGAPEPAPAEKPAPAPEPPEYRPNSVVIEHESEPVSPGGAVAEEHTLDLSEMTVVEEDIARAADDPPPRPGH